jgi:hypothetical protein
MMFALSAHAQTDANAGKSSGPVVVVPGKSVEGAALAMHLPGREYRAGSGWWALACPARCELYPLNLGVTPKLHPAYDSDPVPGQMLRFSPVPPVANILLAFKPLRLGAELKLRAGLVPTYFPGTLPRLRRPNSPGTMEGEIGLPQGQTVRLVPTLVLPHGHLAGTSKNEPKGEPVPEGALKLELHMDGRQQVLGSFNFGIESAIALKPRDYVIWVGDLDGDGKPDFLLNFDFHGTNVALFLSSLAKEGEIVGEAGRFQYFPIDSPGC